MYDYISLFTKTGNNILLNTLDCVALLFSLNMTLGHFSQELLTEPLQYPGNSCLNKNRIVFVAFQPVTLLRGYISSWFVFQMHNTFQVSWSDG